MPGVTRSDLMIGEEDGERKNRIEELNSRALIPPIMYFYYAFLGLPRMDLLCFGSRSSPVGRSRSSGDVQIVL